MKFLKPTNFMIEAKGITIIAKNLKEVLTEQSHIIRVLRIEEYTHSQQKNKGNI
jgi:hypothetical protein